MSSTKNASLTVLIVILPATLTMSSCLSPFGHTDSITIPTLSTGFHVIYEPHVGPSDVELFIDPGRPVRVVGPFDQPRPCYRFALKNEAGDRTAHCLDTLTGSPLTLEILDSNGTALGQEFAENVNAFPTLSYYFGPVLLAGQTLVEGSRFDRYYNGAIFTYDVRRIDSSRAEVEQSFHLYEYPRDYRYNGAEPPWVARQYTGRFYLDTVQGPFPTKITSIEHENHGRETWVYALRDQTSGGDPITFPGVSSVGPACGDCRFHEFDGIPHASSVDEHWPLEQALERGLADDEIRAFRDRNPDIVVSKATYQRVMRRDVILGPIGRDVPSEVWWIRMEDPAAGQYYWFDVEKNESVPAGEITFTQQGQSDYQLPKSAWPSKLADPVTAWERIRRVFPDVRLERLTFNEKLDPWFFGKEDLTITVADPKTKDGLDPLLLKWTLVVGFPDGGGETFDFSAVNGQWLTVPGRYVKATLAQGT